MTKRYTYTEVVEAAQFTHENLEEICNWLNGLGQKAIPHHTSTEVNPKILLPLTGAVFTPGMYLFPSKTGIGFCKEKDFLKAFVPLMENTYPHG